MARFIRIEGIPGKVVCLNTDHVTQVVFETDSDVKKVELYMVGNKTVDIVFGTNEEALQFIEKNFVLFNA